MNDVDHAILVQKTEELVHAIRIMGLYEDQVSFVDEQRPVVVIDLWIGDQAFSKRIQEPEQVDFDAEFQKMVAPVAEDQNEEAINGLRGMLGDA